MIQSRQNKNAKDIRRLRRSKGDHLLLEGPHLVAEALAAGFALETVLATPDFLASDEGQALGPLPHLLEIAPELLADLTDADSPQGLLAVARLLRPGVDGLPVVPGGLYLYLEGLQDPGNLGALARVAEAAGAAGLALSPGTVHPNHPRALRGSAGSLLRLPVATGVTPDDLAHRLGTLGPLGQAAGTDRAGSDVVWAALVPRGGTDLYALAPEAIHGTLVLLLGAEGPGLSPTLAARASLGITIPVAPPVESLNATVAAALVLFEIRRRRSPGDP